MNGMEMVAKALGLDAEKIAHQAKTAGEALDSLNATLLAISQKQDMMLADIQLLKSQVFDQLVLIKELTMKKDTENG